MIKKTEKSFLNIQSDIIDNFSSLEDKENADISFDEWTRDEGGGGITYVIENGKFFDNCAVNFSSIEGEKFIFLGHPWYVCMDSVIVKLQNL